MSNLGQGYWESQRVGSTHTRHTREKDKQICRSIPAVSFSPVFALRAADQNINYIKMQMGPIVRMTR